MSLIVADLELKGVKFYPVRGYERIYSISKCGKVLRHPHIRLKQPLVLKEVLSDYGYVRMALWREGVQKKFHIHRLVAINFIPNPRSLPYVNHIDLDKTNNKVDNLEWVTHQENMDHAIENGLFNNKVLQKPVACIDLVSGKVIAYFDGRAAAGRSLGVPQTNITRVCLGERRHAGGFGWRDI